MEVEESTASTSQGLWEQCIQLAPLLMAITPTASPGRSSVRCEPMQKCHSHIVSNLAFCCSRKNRKRRGHRYSSALCSNKGGAGYGATAAVQPVQCRMLSVRFMLSAGLYMQEKTCRIAFRGRAHLCRRFWGEREANFEKIARTTSAFWDR